MVEKRKIYTQQKTFRQINSLVISLENALISRNFCQKSVRESKYRSFQQLSTLWKNEKFSLTEKNISSNQRFSNLFSKNVDFTKFLPKKFECKFP